LKLYPIIYILSWLSLITARETYIASVVDSLYLRVQAFCCYTN